MTRGLLVAFGHRAQVGKDTAARGLGDGWVLMSFADRVRWVLEKIDPLIHYGPFGATRLSQLLVGRSWETVKQENHEVRRLLQELAMGARTYIDHSVWRDAVMFKALEQVRAGFNVAITDLRFPNEAEAIRGNGGRLIRIDRPEAPRLDHLSESALDDWAHWDAVITNDGTPEDLVESVRAFLDGS